MFAGSLIINCNLRDNVFGIISKLIYANRKYVKSDVCVNVCVNHDVQKWCNVAGFNGNSWLINHEKNILKYAPNES